MSDSNPYAAPDYTPDTNEARVVAPAPVQPEPEAPSPSPVPDGSIKDVLDWVDGDKERAQLALDVENGREKPRKTIVHELEELLAS